MVIIPKVYDGIIGDGHLGFGINFGNQPHVALYSTEEERLQIMQLDSAIIERMASSIYPGHTLAVTLEFQYIAEHCAIFWLPRDRLIFAAWRHTPVLRLHLLTR